MISAKAVGLGEPRAGWGQSPARGLYWSDGQARVAFIAVHYNLDFSEHYLATLLAARGFGFLGWNTRFCGREAFFRFDHALLDVAAGVEWLRSRGIETVVLLGNSGGGSLLAAYQAGSDGGDLYVSLAAHPGRPEVLTNWLDPAVTDELDPVATDPELDVYSGSLSPPFEPEFVSRYREAQRARNDRISAWAAAELRRVREAGYSDRLFTVQRTWADLRFLDGTLDPSDRPVPACYRGDPARANRSVDGLAMASTLRTWLAMWSRSESQYRGEECLPAVSVPSLVVQASRDTGVFPSDARAIFGALGGVDKSYAEVAGDHYFRGPSSPREEVADLIAAWVRERGG